MKKSFLYLFSADVLVVLGEAIGLFCIEVILYQKTGSKGLMGTVAFCFAFPEFVLRLLGTAFIDRFDRVKLMSTLNLIRGITLGVLCTLVFLDYFSVWMFFLASVVLGSCSAWFLPAGMALVPTLLDPKQLVRGYSILESFASIARLGGPFLAALMIGWSGAGWGIGFFAFTLLVGSLLIRFIKVPYKAIQKKKASLSDNPFHWKQIQADLQEGFSFFREVPALTLIMILLAFSNFGFAMWFILLVPLGQELFQISLTQTSFLTSMFALGIITGSFLISCIKEINQRSKMMTGSFVASGLITVGIGLAPTYTVGLVLFFLLGLSLPFFGANSSSTFGQLVPETHRGRVMSIRLLIGQGAIPLGNMAGGWISEGYGLTTVLILAGAISIFVGTIGLFLAPLRQIDGNLDMLARRVKQNLTAKHIDLSNLQKESA